jgi:site-specific recombinase XerD
MGIKRSSYCSNSPTHKQYWNAIVQEQQNNLVFDKRYLVEEPVYNRNLKEIAKLAVMYKNITNKVARHTNSQLWIRYGAERAVLSKMLDHTRQEITRNYYNADLPEIFEGTKRVDFGAMGI